MFGQTDRFLLGEEFESDRDEVNRQNRLAIRYFATAGIPVGIANVLAQLTVKGAAPTLSQHSVWLLGYFCLLFIVDRVLLPRECRHATLLAYALEAPVFIVTILLGTVWDPTHQAMTFLMFMIVMPVFILDKPIRAMGVLIGWNMLFLVLCLLVKDPSTHVGDFSHTLEFLLLALAVTYVVLKLRFQVMQSLDRTRYHLEHDVLTNTRNRRSLEEHIDEYVGKELFVVMGEVDHLSLINDFYGNGVGDEVLNSFCTTLKREFSEGNTYRYSGNDVLCVGMGISESEGILHIERCRAVMRHPNVDELKTDVTCSFGFVMGTPKDIQGIHDMIQLAAINAHRAKQQGEERTIGGVFNAEALREGIIESSLTTHARSYEVNQLTGLPSMAYFVVRTQEMLEHVVLLERRPVIGFLNIVHFRSFNDEFGYEQGDALIRRMAILLHEAFPKRHLTYLSGSQFGVMCYLDEVEEGMKYVSDALQKYKPGRPVYVRAGFAEYHKGDAMISLLDQARLAHDNVLFETGATYRLYDMEIDQEVSLRRYLTSHLDEALEKGWIRVHYQPIVCTDSGKTCNMEALSRWNDPVHGLLPPAQFIGVLEKERLIYKLSLYVVRRILADLKRLSDAGMPMVPVSVNLSRNDFFSCDMVEEITKLVDESGLSREMICIELTESAFVENQELLRHEVDRFRERGFNVWMDDFGSEYSTLNLLQSLNFDLVKIDMQFMRHFEAGGRNAVIVAAIIDMCKHLGVATLVEGVETTDQFELLETMGCDKVQGYLFSPPVPLTDILNNARTKHGIG